MIAVQKRQEELLRNGRLCDCSSLQCTKVSNTLLEFLPGWFSTQTAHCVFLSSTQLRA